MASSELSLPDSLALLIREKDESSTDFDETDLSYVLENRLRDNEIKGEQKKACFAEVAGLQMSLDGVRETSRWGTHFGPVVEAKRSDGTPFCWPDIVDFDEEIMAYWKKRATECRHPVFRARYADLCWDLSKKSTGQKVPIELAQQAIDAYVDCAARFPRSNNCEERLERALHLSLSIGDEGRSTAVIDAMFRLLGATTYAASRLMWLYDLQSRVKNVLYTAEQEQILIDGIEFELARVCEGDKPVGIVAKAPALRLASFYERKGELDDAKRVIRKYGEALEKFAEEAHGIVSMHWYQEAYGIYLKFGLKDEAERFQIAAKKKGEEAREQMVRHTHSVEIPRDEMEVFLDEITEGGLEQAISRIACGIFPKQDDIAEQLNETQSESKLLSMISIAKMGEDQVIARAGSIEGDREGRMMLQLADALKFEAIFLGKAIDRVRERYGVTSNTLLQVLVQCPLFDPERTMLLEQGIDAYLANDHVKAIHVLVPQIEHCLRRLLALLGRPTNKHRRSDFGVMIEKSLNDILESEPVIRECLGEDATYYLRVLLCDARGFNVRNDLAHGLLKPGAFNRFVSDRLMHVIFLLTLLRQEATSSAAP